MIDALILCGGLGTRIRHLLPPTLPKFLAPVWDGRPIGLHIIEWLRDQPEIGNIILSTHYGREQILAADLPVEGIDLDHKLRGIEGAILHAMKARYMKHGLLRTERILICNGDTLIDIPPAFDVYTSFAYHGINTVIDQMEHTGLSVIEQDLLPNIPETKMTMRLAKFIDIGTPEGYARLQEPWP